MKKTTITVRFDPPQSSRPAQAAPDAQPAPIAPGAAQPDRTPDMPSPEVFSAAQPDRPPSAPSPHVSPAAPSAPFPQAEEPERTAMDAPEAPSSRGRRPAPTSQNARSERPPRRAGKVVPLRPNEYVPEPDYPFDYGAGSHSAAREADELERLIRSAGADEGRTGAPGVSGAARPNPPDADGGEPDDLRAETGYWGSSPARGAYDDYADAPRSPVWRSGADASPPWWKLAASVAGAAATGLLFGALLLEWFSGGAPASVPGGPAALPPSEAPAAAENPAGGTGAGSAAAGEAGVPGPGADGSAVSGEAAAAEAVDIPERRMWLLQYGIFSTLGNAQSLADTIREKGYAAVIEKADGYFVYAGIAADRDDALRTGAKLSGEGYDVYVKPYALPAVSEVRWEEGSAEALAGYLAKGTELVRMIGGVTHAHLEGEPAALEPSTLEKLREEHRRLQELQPLASAGLPADARPLLERMDAAARNAVSAVGEYGAHPDHAYLWSAQSALMEYVLAEKQLLTAIALR